MTTNKSHHAEREDPANDPKTKPFLPLARELFERNVPFTDEELTPVLGKIPFWKWL